MSALVPKLLSVSLLHRHGARGPGGSELKPFEETSPTKQQWKKEEEEEITIVGNEQMIQLGTYFASKYIPIFNREGKDNLTGRTFWRSSKAARAKESGVSLVKGLNSFDKEYISVNGDVKYDVDADYYMRPWKIYKAAMDSIKTNAESDEEWIQLATSNHDLLKRILIPIGMTDKTISKPIKAMWSATYVSCLLAVEGYWPEVNGVRNALTAAVKQMEAGDLYKMQELALWVWQKRFLECDVYPLFGGLLTSEILERCLDDSLSMNVYSAHDYTVLSVLSNLRVLPVYESMMYFACTVTFEVWSSLPPDHPSGPARIPLVDGGEGSGKVIRILLNNNPFNDTRKNIDTSMPPLHLCPTSEVQPQNEVCLADLSEASVREMVIDIRGKYTKLSESAVVTAAKTTDQDTE